MNMTGTIQTQKKKKKKKTQLGWAIFLFLHKNVGPIPPRFRAVQLTP